MHDKLPAPELPDWLDEQLPFERYMIEVEDGLRMHVMEQGEGAPVLLFHGNPTWGYLYRKVVAELSGERYRLIMPDLIGLGFSDRPAHRSDHTLENHARWMGSLVRRLDLGSTTFVVQDWGGPIGLHAAYTNPGVMSALVVSNTAIDAPRPGFKPTLFHRFFSTLAGDALSKWLGLPQNAMRYAQGDRTSIAGIVQKSYTYPLRGKDDYQAVIGLVRMTPDDMDHPSIPYLKEAGEAARSLDGPKAIVWGDNDPVLGRLRRRVSRQLPDAEVTATDAGHFLHEEVPDRIAEAIRSVTTSR